MNREQRFSNITRFDEPRIVDLNIKIIGKNGRKILITKNTLRKIYDHANGDMQHEVGGYLLGKPLIEKKSLHPITYISEIVEGLYDSTPTFITIRPETFHQVEIVRREKSIISVGYYHSHPNMQIFQSPTDITYYSTYFIDKYQIAIVVNPGFVKKDNIFSNLNWIGFFFWNEENVSERLNNYEDIYIILKEIEGFSSKRKRTFKIASNLLNHVGKSKNKSIASIQDNQYFNRLENFLEFPFILLLKILFVLIITLLVLLIILFIKNGN